MAEIVAQHQLSPITTPQNGDNLDATVVTGHFGSVVSDYNAHDADPGIHVQSGTTLPAVGTLGRKFLLRTTVLGRVQYQLYFDDTSAWQEVTGATFAVSNAQPSLYDAGNSGTSLAIDWRNGPVQKVTLTGNATLTFTNGYAGGGYTLILVQDGTGGRTVSLTGWDFGDNAPTYNTGVNKKNVVSAVYDGTDYLAAFAVKGG